MSLTPHWLPTGWFQIGWSDDVPMGTVRPLRYFGNELVTYRDTDGRLHVLDAYCRHLGGHLGYGGHVQGDCVVCPFHGWHWNGEGRNTHIPYQPDRPNKARRVRVWPVHERFGIVYVWHGVEGREPSWEPPNIFTDTSPHTSGLDYHPASPHGLSDTALCHCIRRSCLKTPQTLYISAMCTARSTIQSSCGGGRTKRGGSAR